VGRTIACANQKGGVGKTTTVVNLSSYLALAGDRVLVIDLDPQGNATSGLGGDRSGAASVYEAIVDEQALESLIQPTAVPGLDLVPSSIALAGAEVELAPLEQRERRLGRLLAPIADRYDHLVIDCPPSLGLLTVNALTAADGTLIPIQCEYYALEGLTQLIATINLVRDHLNPELAVDGAVLTMFDGRTNLSAQVAAEVAGRPLYVTIDIDVLDPAVAPDDGTVVARPKVGIRFEGWEVICPGGVDPRASYAKRGALFRLHLPMRHGEANGRVAEGAVKGGVQSTAKTWQQ